MFMSHPHTCIMKLSLIKPWVCPAKAASHLAHVIHLKSMPHPESNQNRPDAVDWSRTISRAELERLKNSKLFEEPDSANLRGKDVEGRPAKYGWWKNRHVIGRDEVINGGIYLGGGGREEIVVDDRADPELYQWVYDHLWHRIRTRLADQRHKGERADVKNGILSDVFETVQSLLAYDETTANAYADAYRDKKVDLGVFVREGKGVCRHQALLAAYLLERLGRDGTVSGHASVDRNAIRGLGAHAWTRYTNSAGEVWIIDPAQDFIGPLDQAPQEGWSYDRPEDTH